MERQHFRKHGWRFGWFRAGGAGGDRRRHRRRRCGETTGGTWASFTDSNLTWGYGFHGNDQLGRWIVSSGCCDGANGVFVVSGSHTYATRALIR